MKKLLQKIVTVLLAAAAALALAAGNGCIPMKSTEAAASDKKITVKAASDFTLKFPADWKNQYVKKASRDKKHGSYVAFYSKKCYKETKEGWLFPLCGLKTILTWICRIMSWQADGMGTVMLHCFRQTCRLWALQKRRRSSMPGLSPGHVEQQLPSSRLKKKEKENPYMRLPISG